MPRERKNSKEFNELIANKRKKFVRYKEGAELYSLGIHSFEQLAKDARAIYRFKTMVLVNIEIVDEYLEHSRVMYFYNKGREDIYISSADWMTRNLDYRIEAAAQITQKNLKKEIKDQLEIQLSDNVKARILDKKLRNEYVQGGKEPVRSQIETYHYLKNKSILD